MVRHVLFSNLLSIWPNIIQFGRTSVLYILIRELLNFTISIKSDNFKYSSLSSAAITINPMSLDCSEKQCIS